ncbi:MAG: helix-hairpin-helix domain-containing protein, partial [Staphylococcus simulans]|nr:helix-hairpin-helix domain-containing protein [Staphylococcus simulans]
KIGIENENEAYLTKFPGIGKKTARQIILDLKGKVQITDESADTLLQQPDTTVSGNSPVLEEALLALEALGYSKRELKKVEKKLSTEQFESVDEAVKAGLKILVS